MRKAEQEIVASIYNRVEKMKESATQMRNSLDPKTPQHIMMCGKVKAYVDVLCNIRDRYGNRMALSDNIPS